MAGKTVLRCGEDVSLGFIMQSYAKEGILDGYLQEAWVVLDDRMSQ
jgi:hypothetical protein